jgi:hypothetical protein
LAYTSVESWLITATESIGRILLQRLNDGIIMEHAAAAEADSPQTSTNPKSHHRKGFGCSALEPLFPKADCELAVRKPAAICQPQAVHAAPFRSSETVPRPCEPSQPQAKAGYSAAEAHPRCTSRSLHHGRPTVELQAE